MLLDYAEIYPTLPVRYYTFEYGDARGARITSTNLEESLWLTKLTWAFDLVYPLMTQNERALVEWNLLRSAANHLMQDLWGKSNHQVWHNAAIGLVGYAIYGA